MDPGKGESLDARDDSLLKRLDAFDEALSTELDDARFSSGVPEGLRADDDEFLLMAGLGAQADPAEEDEEVAPVPAARDADVDTSRPLSFHEDGVEDVDGSQQADASVAAESSRDELTADVYAATPRSDLRALIAGLSQPTSGAAEPIPSGPPIYEAFESETEEPAPAAATASDGEHGHPDETVLEDMLDRVKGDILAGLRADLSALTHAQEEVAAALAERRAPAADVDAEDERGHPDETVLEGMLDRVKGDILAGLRADLSALTHAQEEVAAGQREAAAALSEQRAAVAALQKVQAAARALDDFPAPVAPVPAPALAPAAPIAELAEAERLIRELRAPSAEPPQSAEIPDAPDDRIDLNALPSGSDVFEAEDADLDPDAPEHLAAGDEGDASIYNQPRREHVRRSSRLRRRRRRIVLALATLAAVSALGFAAFRVMPAISQRFVGPETLSATAAALMESEQYVQASNTYQQWVNGYPDSPGAEHAAFMAGYALACIPQGLGERHYTAAIRLFDEFEQRYPDSDKTPRSRLLRGVLQHRLGNHVDAITLLSDVAQAQRADSSTVLPALRTLARAHAARGEFDAARSKLMQVISLPENFALDRDYEELAALSATQAAESSDPAVQAQWAAEAEKYYQLALALPSVEPARKRMIELGLAELGRMRREGFPAETEADSAGFTATTEIQPEPDLAPPMTEQVILPSAAPDAAEPADASSDAPLDPAAESPAPPVSEGEAEGAPDATTLEEGLRDAAAPAEAPLTTEALPDLDAPLPAPGEGDTP